MARLKVCRRPLENSVRTCEHEGDVTHHTTEMRATKRLLVSLGGVERLARLRMLYDQARPRRSRWTPGILTAEEVFRDNARKDGYSDEGIVMFIDQLDLGCDI